MAQGKLKVKTKVPQGVKSKKPNKNVTSLAKRINKPIQPKKSKMKSEQKMKKLLTKNLNKAIEEEVRSVAYSSNTKLNLSKAQKAVAQQNIEPT
ncbi:uncharacterized protein LOC108734208 [Agrilus planipennis]|uniref:Uncharacterized protein LOC108734208 n=1 Tax=Agrilus planipennis TaxID=224129 RepID=A0A1W4WM12_AGRPL|nr:uncharacterized protein LOC108734208 [Agrilus planipennis]